MALDQAHVRETAARMLASYSSRKVAIDMATYHGNDHVDCIGAKRPLRIDQPDSERCPFYLFWRAVQNELRKGGRR